MFFLKVLVYLLKLCVSVSVVVVKVLKGFVEVLDSVVCYNKEALRALASRNVSKGFESVIGRG